VLAPLSASGISRPDYGVMRAFSVVLLPMLWSGLKLRRIDGGILIFGYVAHLLAIW